MGLSTDFIRQMAEANQAENSKQEEGEATETVAQEQTESVETQSNDTTDSSLTDSGETKTEVQETENQVQEQTAEAPSQGEGQAETVSEETSNDAPVEFENVNDYANHLLSEASEDEELMEAIKETFGFKDSPSYANEQMAQLDKFVRETGRTPDEFYFVQNLEVESLKPIDVVRNKLALENPTASIDDIDAYVNNKYKLDEDEFSEQEMKIGKFELAKDSNDAKKWLSNLKEEYSKPIDGYTPQKTSEGSNLLGVDSKTYMEKLKDSTNLESFNFKLGNEDFEFKLDDSYSDTLYKSLANEKDPLAGYRAKDGSLDTDKLAEATAILDNIDKIVNAAYNQGRSNATEQVVKTKKNVDFSDERGEPRLADEKSEAQKKNAAVLDKAFGGRLRFR